MLVYLNGFPRENAKKGDKFEGSDALKEELEGRNIIGEVEETTEVKVAPKDSGANGELQGQVETLTASNGELQGQVETLTSEKDTLAQESGDEIVKLKAQLVEAINLKKGDKPAGYEE